MKIKLIFWDDEPLLLSRSNVKVVQDIRGERYYEKISPYLIEYVQINKSQAKSLYRETGSRDGEITVLFVIGQLSNEDLNIIKKLQANCSKTLHIFTEPIKGAVGTLKEEINKCHSYVPGMNAKDILEMLPVFVASTERLGHKESLDELNGSTLIMGYEQLDSGIGKLVNKVFENWQYMSKCPYVKLNLYSQQKLGISELSELEDIFYEYTAEGAKLELNWHKSSKVDTQIYFLIEGN